MVALENLQAFDDHVQANEKWWRERGAKGGRSNEIGIAVINCKFVH